MNLFKGKQAAKPNGKTSAPATPKAPSATVTEGLAVNGVRPLLTIKDVAAWLRISVRSVEQLVAMGYLVPIRVKGRIRRFSPSQVEAYLRYVAGRQSGLHSNRRAA